jgi:F-type H+-transporting ATPase subunit b
MRLLRVSALTVSLSLAALPLRAQEAMEAVGEAAAPAGEEAHSGGLPQFDPHWFASEFLWLAITFVAMYGIFSVLILPAIGGTLETRRQRVEGDLAGAERMKGEAEAARKAVEAGLDGARSEATGIITDVHGALKAKAESSANAFRETMEREMTALETRLAKAKKAAMDDMHTIAAEVANEAARKIVGLDIDPKNAHNVVKALSTREAA